MSFAYPIFHYPAYMMKDMGQKFTLMAHNLVHRRRFYPVMKHQNIKVYKTLMPNVEDAAFVAPSAAIVGNVIFGANSSAMYHANIRNYHTENSTRIGDNTSILDNVTFMGACRVGSNCVIGIGSTMDCAHVMENVILGSHVHLGLEVVVEQGAIIATGSTVPKDTRVPANELWAGNPAVKIGDVTPEQRDHANALARKHVELAKNHKIAIAQHYAESGSYDARWLAEMCDRIEAHQMSVAFEEDIKLPIESKRFLQPRVHARLPHLHVRVSYPTNRIAPHMTRPPDWTGNA